MSLSIVTVKIIAVRRRDNVRDAIRRGPFAHLQGFFPGFWTIIDPRQEVTVNIDHHIHYSLRVTADRD